MHSRTKPHFEQGSLTATTVLPWLFVVLFVQIAAINAVSFISQHGPIFVQRVVFGFGYDYHDFYLGAADILQGLDPYLRGRLFTPPSSTILGFALVWLPFQAASLVWFGINIVLIHFSLHLLAQQWKLNRENRWALFGILWVFYPFYFLIERGNLDGIMLTVLTLAFAAQNWVIRGVALGVSVSVKVYSGLFFPILLMRRKWKIALVGLLVFILFQLPFQHLLLSFFHAVTGRSGLMIIEQNLCPAPLFQLIIGHTPRRWKNLYYAFWAGTLLLRLWKDRDNDIAQVWPMYTPWMMSFPLLVFPYTGILALPLIAKIASECQQRKPLLSHFLILAGFAMLGFQAIAWTDFLNLLGNTDLRMHSVCAAGVAMMMVGTCISPNPEMLLPEPALDSPSI
ncbi:MAG: glycosyltransferase family 87 protein [Terracidiphilus sp.]|nr:glycosyltransferase family 87 protein [Terracidiphilus sp.]